MKHTIIYKNKNEYASFPLIQKHEDRISISFFVAPVPDHMGIFKWKIMQSFDRGKAWESLDVNPGVVPRAASDMFEYKLGENIMMTGSYGFMRSKNHEKIFRSKGLSVRAFDSNYEVIDQEIYIIPTADIVLTFPRPLVPKILKDFDYTWKGEIRLIPAYAVLKNGTNRALAWRSEDSGQTWRLYNMFPSEVNVNEMAFIWTNKGILAHLRSDQHPYIMESWSKDGITWTYPTNIFSNRESNRNIIGGPPHLLRLNDNRILCTYGYRFNSGKEEKGPIFKTGMGIRAIISEDEGNTWNNFFILRDDGGYCSSLRKKKFWQKKVHAGNDVGYPTSIQLDNNKILTAYYITCKDQITGIETTEWEYK